MYIKRLWREAPDQLRVVRIKIGKREPEAVEIDQRIIGYFAKWI